MAPPPRDDTEKARPAAKGRKADDSNPSPGNEHSGKRKKSSRPPAVPKEVRSAMALLILVAFIQGVGLYLLHNAASEVILTSQGEMLLKIVTGVDGGIACLALGAAFLLRAGMWLGRVLTFLVAIISILLALAAVVVGNWVVFGVWLAIGISILMFADTKGVRKYIREKNRRTPTKEEGDEDADAQDLQEAPSKDKENEDSGARPRRKK